MCYRYLQFLINNRFCSFVCTYGVDVMHLGRIQKSVIRGSLMDNGYTDKFLSGMITVKVYITCTQMKVLVFLFKLNVKEEKVLALGKVHV